MRDRLVFLFFAVLTTVALLAGVRPAWAVVDAGKGHDAGRHADAGLVDAGHLDAGHGDAGAANAIEATQPILDAAAEEPEPVAAIADAGLVAPASASAAPSAAPAEEADAGASAGPVEVKVHDRVVFVIHGARGNKTAAARAKDASKALESILEHEGDIPEARVEERADTTSVFVGEIPIVTFGVEDARAAGEESTKVLAAHVAALVQDTLRSEKRRAAIAAAVFSFSLLIFSGLITFLLLRRTNDLSHRAAVFLREQPERLPAIRLGQIEVLSRGTVRGSFGVAIALGHRLLQVAIVYAWLIIALSLFDATRGYTERLTGYVLLPLSSLANRTGATLPVLVVAAIAVLAVSILVRFIGLFFEAVERGETQLEWLPQDLARPTSVLLRGALVLVALVLGSPLVTGTDDGALSRVGVVALVALGAAAVPILATGAVGVAYVFGRRFRVGDFVESAGRVGQVKETTLLELRLEDAMGCELRVPHLLTLVRPTRVLGPSLLVSLEVTIDPEANQRAAHTALLGAARTLSSRATVALLRLDAEGALYRVTGADLDPHGSNLIASLTAALAKEGIALGRAPQRDGDR